MHLPALFELRLQAFVLTFPIKQILVAALKRRACPLAEFPRPTSAQQTRAQSRRGGAAPLIFQDLSKLRDGRERAAHYTA